MTLIMWYAICDDHGEYCCIVVNGVKVPYGSLLEEYYPVVNAFLIKHDKCKMRFSRENPSHYLNVIGLRGAEKEKYVIQNNSCWSPKELEKYDLKEF